MRKLFTFMAAAAFLFGTTAAHAAIFPATANLSVAISTLPVAGFAGGAAAASSVGVGGAATLPANSLAGIFQTAISPPLLGLLDGIAVAAPGAPLNVPLVPANAANNLASFNGVTGTMALNASAYLLMGGVNVAEIPIGVVGVGGTQGFHVLTLVAGVINANPYQLGMLTVMGALNTAPHTLVATGVDNRTAGGAGTLVLVSPTAINLGALGVLASLATLTITYVPEPGTLLLLGAGVAGLAAIGRKRMA